MFKEVLNSKTLNETYYKYVLDNGLELYVLPKREQRSNYAVFGTKFGSVHVDYSDAQGNERHMPKGIAHFLEHKLFESEELDAFERFTKTGANANAYTSFDRTCYLFSCTDNFYESYDILLDFVQSPYFTEETVLKEQGIIGQEIKMYDDMGSWRVYMNALKALYRNIPINVDIAGTVQEISKITSQNLYQCYEAFYNPGNMFICICGNVDEDEVLRFTTERIKSKPSSKPQTLYLDEPSEICKKNIHSKAVVSIPQFVIAFKNDALKGEFIDYRSRVIKTMLLDILVSKRSKLYTKLLNDNLINNEFGAEVFDGPGYCSCMFMGESVDPEKVKSIICNEINLIAKSGIDNESFEMSKRYMYGNFVKQFDSVDSVVAHLVDGAVSGYNFFDFFDIINSITVDDLNNEINKTFDEKRMILSVVEPIDRNEG